MLSQWYSGNDKRRKEKNSFPAHQGFRLWPKWGCMLVYRTGVTELPCVLIAAVIMQVYAFVTCHKSLHQKAIFTVHKLYDDGNEGSKPPQRRPWDLWDLDLTVSCLASVRHGKHSRMKANTSCCTAKLFSVVFVWPEDRTQLWETLGSVPAEAGLGPQGCLPQSSRHCQENPSR